MIKFIDLSTGNIFNGDVTNTGDGYTFYFDNEQSTGLVYVKRICVITDYQSINVSLSDKEQTIFRIIDVNSIKSVLDDINSAERDKQVYSLSGTEYYDINAYKQGENSITNHLYTDFVSTGEEYVVGSDTYYIHLLYFSAQSYDSGEFICDFEISEEGSNAKSQFRIGADFYNQSENLAINLLNQGFEVPNAIGRAIYDSNIHEDYNDNILLNRKYKELLNEYINILNNKGSYKSLINALNWFEYKDLVKIYEYWKHDEPNKPYLSNKDLCNTVNIEELINSFRKTTYIGLYFALYKICGYKDTIDLINETPQAPDPDDNILQGGGNVRNLPEPIPDVWFYNDSRKLVVDKFIKNWSAIDLYLKMTLLGNFYATYFMPIHLDLIHSTVESIIYTNTIKHLSWGSGNRLDFHNDVESFICKFDNKNLSIGPVECAIYKDTIFGEAGLLDRDTKYIVGVEGVEDGKYEGALDSEEDRDNFLKNLYNDLGCVVDFKCIIDRIPTGSTIYYGEILCFNKKDKAVDYINTYRFTGESTSFKLLFYTPGEYQLSIRLRTDTGKSYISVVNVNIEDSLLQDVDLYKVIRKRNIADDDIYKPDCFNYIWSCIKDKKIDKYNQYLMINNTNDVSSIGLNQVVVCKFPNNPDNSYQGITAKMSNGDTVNIQLVERDGEYIVTGLENYSNYNCYVMDKYNRLDIDGDIADSETTKYAYIVNTEFSCKDKRYLLRKHNIGVSKNGKHNNCVINLGLFLHKRFQNINTYIPEELVFLNVLSGSNNVKDIYINNINIDTDRLYRYFDSLDPKLDTLTKQYLINSVKDINNILWYNNGIHKMNLAKTRVITKIPEYTTSFNLNVRFKDGNTVVEHIDIPETLISSSPWIVKINGSSVDDEAVMQDIFIPAFHESILCENNIIDRDDTICVKPDIYKLLGSDDYKLIGWELIKRNTGETLMFDDGVVPQELIIGNFTKFGLKPGYYDIVLKYSLSKEKIKTIRITSSFLLK